MNEQPRDRWRRFQSPAGPHVSDLERFASYCRFDPLTGCVLWTGGTSAGRGNSARYGSFWFAGRRWSAHRWSAVHIHGLELAPGDEVGHCCPHGPNTLCVEHVGQQTKRDNVAEGNVRRATVRTQGAHDRQFWLLVGLGLEPAPAIIASDPNTLVPFYTPPAWLVGAARHGTIITECPF